MKEVLSYIMAIVVAVIGLFALVISFYFIFMFGIIFLAGTAFTAIMSGDELKRSTDATSRRRTRRKRSSRAPSQQPKAVRP